jgi:hypothetical protein
MNLIRSSSRAFNASSPSSAIPAAAKLERGAEGDGRAGGVGGGRGSRADEKLEIAASRAACPAAFARRSSTSAAGPCPVRRRLISSGGRSVALSTRTARRPWMLQSARRVVSSATLCGCSDIESRPVLGLRIKVSVSHLPTPWIEFRPSTFGDPLNNMSRCCLVCFEEPDIMLS